MTFVIDYDQLVPILFFVGLLIGYAARKIVKRRKASIARVISFLLVFIIIFIVKSIYALLALAAVFITVGALSIMHSVERERHLAYILTILLTIIAIALATSLVESPYAALIISLRVLTLGFLYITLFLTLPTIEMTYTIRVLFGNYIATLFLVSMLIFRKVIDIIEKIQISIKTKGISSFGLIKKIVLSADIVVRRAVPLIERSVDDIVTALYARGVDLSSSVVYVPAGALFTKDDVFLLISVVTLLVISIVLLCHP